MLTFDESELKYLLACCIVPEPPEALIRKTRERLYREQASLVAAPAAEGYWILALTGLALAMALCVFYTFMVESILQLLVPAEIGLYLQKSLVVLTAAGGSMIAAIFTMFAFRYFMLARSGQPACAVVRTRA